jgi:predicted ester cyclase
MPVPALANEAADLIRQFYMAVDADNPDPAVYDAMLAEDFIDNDRPQIAPSGVADRDVTLALFAELEQAFPDAVHRIDILEPIGTDRAVVYWTFEGRHEGSFFGAPASGREVSINGIDIFRT